MFSLPVRSPKPPLRRLAEFARVDLWDDDAPPPHEELCARLKHCDGVLSMVSDRFDEATIAGAPRLAAISNLAVGLDNIDLAAATRMGVAVGHTPGVLSETTADLAFALMLAVARRVAESDRFVRAGRWRVWTPRLMLGRTSGARRWVSWASARLGRRSRGGQRLRHARALCGCMADRHAPSRAAATTQPAVAIGAAMPQPMELMQLLREADFVSLNVPLIAGEPHHLIGPKEIAAMKRGAILINTARGAVVDQQALAAALSAGRLGGAGSRCQRNRTDQLR